MNREHYLFITYKNRLQWMTNKLRNQIQEKNALYIKSIKTNNIEVKNKYTTTKNKLLSDLRNAEIEYFSNELELNKSDISKCWNVLKDIIGRNCKAKQRKVTFITDNGCISDSVMIANEFKDFFVSIGDKLASKITSNINPLSFVNFFTQFNASFQIVWLCQKYLLTRSCKLYTH